MEFKSQAQEDMEKIDKTTNYLLPNKFKIVGLVLFIISLILNGIIDFSFETIGFKDLLLKIAKTGVIFGLLLISISKEKIEDELIIKLRMQSYSYAFIVGVLFAMIMPFINYSIVFIFSSAPKMEMTSDFTILGVLLSIQILIFRKLKKAYNEE
ncbi:hypothetical protein [Flavobacterium frigoris]|uniref:Uncharacterized protein n=1 Tax=Flavobacterium frigoris TaxID=229204 RepID=A0A1H9D3W3_FLAFI|nr:hypothetical protein [Flavobacterium frigoris]SEQ08039.1 hypothetical protein SAMN05444355_101362 [Flavobacterium frigoris]